MKSRAETKYIDLTSDFGFKKLFGEEPNKDLLISFLNGVFRGRKVILDLERWLFLLKNMSQLDKIPVYLRKSIFEKVFDIATYNKLNKEERMAYDMSLKKKWDEYSIKQTAFNEGVAEGEKKGKLEEKHNIARNLLALGLSIAQIAKSTGLSEEEVIKLAQGHSE